MMFLPFVVFWVLLVAGLYLQELNLKSAAVFVGVWLIGVTVLSVLHAAPALGVVLYVLLDLILILKIFGGNIGLR